ncbi:MAG: CPBP family intramembrane metalloprotease [Planctomycetes bacterium]|nr:CPBP family intramembrane metalloprotease [Planctomycetota bacterium]
MRGRHWGMVALAGVVYSAMTAGGVVWIILRDGREAFWLILAEDLLSSAGLGVGLATAILWFSAYASEHHEWAKTLEIEFGVALGGLSSLQCVALAVASGIGEEMLFRAALQPTATTLAAKIVASRALQHFAGITITSLAFGACHFPFRKNLLPWTAFTIVTAYGFGAIFLWTGNVMGPILAHALINGVNLSRIARKGSPSGPVIAISERGGSLEFDRK